MWSSRIDRRALGAVARNIAAALVVCLAYSTLAAAEQSCPAPAEQPTPAAMQALARDAKDRGFLWTIEQDGSTSYLYGTIHLGKKAWLMPGPKVKQAILSSEVVALELDILDPAIQTQMRDPGNFGIESFDLPAPLQARMQAVARRVCAPIAGFGDQHPSLQFATLSIFDARFSGLELSYGSEVFLAGFARSARKQVRSLETVQAQMRALLGTDAARSLEAIERGMTLLENGKARAVMARMSNAWASGDLAELEQYQQWCECAQSEVERDALRALNDARNPGLAAGIDRLARGGKRVFAAVGSLHMTGPNALPKLLERMGYQVERVSFH